MFKNGARTLLHFVGPGKGVGGRERKTTLANDCSSQIMHRPDKLCRISTIKYNVDKKM